MLERSHFMHSTAQVERSFAYLSGGLFGFAVATYVSIFAGVGHQSTRALVAVSIVFVAAVVGGRGWMREHSAVPLAAFAGLFTGFFAIPDYLRFHGYNFDQRLTTAVAAVAFVGLAMVPRWRRDPTVWAWVAAGVVLGHIAARLWFADYATWTGIVGLAGGGAIAGRFGPALVGRRSWPIPIGTLVGLSLGAALAFYFLARMEAAARAR